MTAFADAVRDERARLALIDPEGEREAIAPLARITAARRLMDHPTRPSAGPARSGAELLQRIGADPSRRRGVVRCPAHDDRRPSLSWRLADDGRALIHCHAGCTFAEILEAVR